MRRLKGGKPRRFKDHRKTEARPYNDTYEMIADRYKPPDRLGCKLVGILADFFLDYDHLRMSKQKGAESARRKTFGLILGGLKVVRDGVNGTDEPHDLAKMIAQLTRDAS